MAWFTLAEHPDDHMLYVRESYVETSRPIRHTFWHPIGWKRDAYCLSFDADHIGQPLVPVEGPDLAFRFINVSGVGYLFIENQIPCTVQQYEREVLLPPEIKKRFRDTIIPEWHEGRWMYSTHRHGSPGLRPILPSHVVRQSRSHLTASDE